MNASRLPVLVLTFCLVFLAACAGDDTPAAPDATPEATQTPEAPAPAEPAPAPAPAYDGPAFEITMTPVGEQMEYEQTEFTVHPGQTVHITFQNTATNPAMHHNVVVLKSGASTTEVGQAAIAAAADDYIPASKMDQIIAHTPMSAPGETVEVTFTAPAEGDYPYLCTYPGHYVTMVGTMHVVAE